MQKIYTAKEVTMHQGAPPRLFGFAKTNRHTPTQAEEILWNALKNKQLGGYKFRRQHPVGVYSVDFYCHTSQLVIELDGGYHDAPRQKAYDEYRTLELARMGIREIRFRNEDLLNDYWGVLEGIWATLLPTP